MGTTPTRCDTGCFCPSQWDQLELHNKYEPARTCDAIDLVLHEKGFYNNQMEELCHQGKFPLGTTPSFDSLCHCPYQWKGVSGIGAVKILALSFRPIRSQLGHSPIFIVLILLIKPCSFPLYSVGDLDNLLFWEDVDRSQSLFYFVPQEFHSQAGSARWMGKRTNLLDLHVLCLILRDMGHKARTTNNQTFVSAVASRWFLKPH